VRPAARLYVGTLRASRAEEVVRVFVVGGEVVIGIREDIVEAQAIESAVVDGVGEVAREAVFGVHIGAGHGIAVVSAIQLFAECDADHGAACGGKFTAAGRVIHLHTMDAVGGQGSQVLDVGQPDAVHVDRSDGLPEHLQLSITARHAGQ
jgi:hypothetical protein